MKFIIAVFFLTASYAGAHGEDKPGPHGGAIRMPGAFHTEVVSVNERQIQVYLLDIDWKNPSTKSGQVTASVKGQKGVAGCVAKADHFVCDFPKNVSLAKTGELMIEARREGQRGNTAVYALPLTKH